MTSSAFWAYGSKLKLGDGASPEVFTTIAELKDITPPQLTRDSIEVSNQDSTSAWREHIPGWRDGAEVTFNANWIPINATQDEDTGVLETFNDNTNHNWQILLPDASTLISFSGHVTAFNPELPMESQGELSVTIKISGPVTIAS